MEIIYRDIYEWQEPVLTEKYTSELLQETPLNADVTYLSVAWSTLIDKLDFGSKSDKDIARRHIEQLSQLQLHNAFPSNNRSFVFTDKLRPPWSERPEESFKNILEPSPASTATAMMIIMIVVMKQP